MQLWRGIVRKGVSYRVLRRSVFSLSVLARVWVRQEQNSEATTALAPLDQAGVISRATFWWVMPILKKAHATGKLDKQDLPQLAHADQPARLNRAFEGAFRSSSVLINVSAADLCAVVPPAVERPRGGCTRAEPDRAVPPRAVVPGDREVSWVWAL